MSVVTETLKEKTFGSGEVCRLAEISYRQLDYWVRTEVVQPSVNPAAGSGSSRLYSFEDLLCIAAINRLRRIHPDVSTGLAKEVLSKIRSSPERPRVLQFVFPDLEVSLWLHSIEKKLRKAIAQPWPPD